MNANNFWMEQASALKVASSHDIMHLISVSKWSDHAFIMVSDFYGVLDPAFVPAYYTTKKGWIDELE